MIYLDNASTTPVDEEVLTTYLALLRTYYANPSSIHHLGRDAHFLLEKSRKQLLSLFQTKDHRLVFTSGATEANNLLIKGVAFAYQKRGKHIITSEGEHPSVLQPLFQLRDHFGFDLTILPLTNNGTISIDDLKNVLREDTILVTVMHVNNETGAISPLEEIASLLKTYPKIIFHSDITQSLGKIDVPFALLDAFSFSAHKIHGLKGSGALCLRKHLELMPLLAGGGQEFGLRSGTQNLCSDIVLAKTVRLALRRYVEVTPHVAKLSMYLKQRLETMADIQLNSPENAIPQIFNFSTVKHKASILVEGLSKAEIMVASTSACSSKEEKASRIIQAMFQDHHRATNTIRISLSHQNRLEDIDGFLAQLTSLLKDIKTR